VLLGCGGVLVGLALSAVVATAHGPIAPQPVEWVPGQLLVRLEPGSTPSPRGRCRETSPGPDLAQRAIRRRDGAPAAPALRADSPAGARGIRQGASGPARRPRADGSARPWCCSRPAATRRSRDGRGLRSARRVEVAEPNYLARLVESVSTDPASAAQASRTLAEAALGAQRPRPRLAVGPRLHRRSGGVGHHSGLSGPGHRHRRHRGRLDHPDLAAKIWVNDDPVGTPPATHRTDGCRGCAVSTTTSTASSTRTALASAGRAGVGPDYADDDDENGYVDDFRGWDWIASARFPDNDPRTTTATAPTARALPPRRPTTGSASPAPAPCAR